MPTSPLKRERHPVVLVEGKVRRRCDLLEKEIVSYQENIAALRRRSDTERDEHIQIVEHLLEEEKEVRDEIFAKQNATEQAIRIRDEQTE